MCKSKCRCPIVVHLLLVKILFRQSKRFCSRSQRHHFERGLIRIVPKSMLLMLKESMPNFNFGRNHVSLISIFLRLHDFTRSESRFRDKAPPRLICPVPIIRYKLVHGDPDPRWTQSRGGQQYPYFSISPCKLHVHDTII